MCMFTSVSLIKGSCTKWYLYSIHCSIMASATLASLRSFEYENALPNEFYSIASPILDSGLICGPSEHELLFLCCC